MPNYEEAHWPVEYVAAMLHAPVSTVEKWAKEGAIPGAIRIRKIWRFHAKSLCDFLEANRTSRKTATVRQGPLKQHLDKEARDFMEHAQKLGAQLRRELGLP